MGECAGKRCISTPGNDDKYSCQSVNKTDGYNWCCTMPEGHAGDHIACGGASHDYATWPRTEEDTEMAKHKCEEKCRQTDYGGRKGAFKHCGEEDPDDGYICTLPQGHFGEHVACNDYDHELKVWENEEDRVEPPKFEITLDAFEAAVVMRLTGNISGSSKEKTAANAIYRALKSSGANSAAAKKPNQSVTFQE